MYASFLYRSLPSFLQSLLVSVRSLARDLFTEGALYEKCLVEILSTQWLSRQELYQYQNDMIYSILENCKENISYYKHILPASLRPYKDDIFPLLYSLPIVDRSTILKFPEKFLNTKKNIIFRGTTSGSTGVPFKICQDYNTIVYETAFVFRQLAWAGYRAREPRVWIRGDMIVPRHAREAPFWRYDCVKNMLLMSSYHISPETCDAYIVAIETFNPVLIQAYPSSIGALAKYLDFHDRDIKCDTIRAIVVSSEMLSMEVQALVEKRFGARVYNWYGSFERIAAIGTCEYGTLHSLSDYSYTEFITACGGNFSINGTTFHNFTMPLIRYGMDDEFSGYSQEYECKCGRRFPTVEKIIGRDDDYIITPEGYRVGRLAHVLDGVPEIMGAQVFQESIDSITVLVVPAASAEEKSYINAITNNMRSRLGNEIEINIEVVTELKKTRNGKVKFINSKVK